MRTWKSMLVIAVFLPFTAGGYGPPAERRIEAQALQDAHARSLVYAKVEGVTVPNAVSRADVVGRYYKGDGAENDFRLSIRDDGFFDCAWHGCAGINGTSKGTWLISGSCVILYPTEETGMMRGHLNITDVLLHNGNIILVPVVENGLLRFWSPSRYSCFQRSDAQQELVKSNTERGIGKQPVLSCHLSSKKVTYPVGTPPKFDIRITNHLAQDIYLAGSLDKSNIRRFPRCYFEVNGKPLDFPPGCGNTDALKEPDFVKVSAGGTFDPFQNDFFGPYFPDSTFPRPGKYRIQFFYSTASDKMACWDGDLGLDRRTDEMAARMRTLFEQVPKTSIVSNEIFIEVTSD